MGTVVLDANIVIGFLRPDNALHRVTREALGGARQRGDTFILPATVLAETLVGTARERPDRIEAQIQTMIGLFGPERVVDRDVAVAAARLRARHPSLRLPDALVVATGVVDNATVLTSDRRLGVVDARVQVLVP
ncbi:MAG: PIN domain-containing protein [Pseudonocardia sp.]|nr:PIN domain-containing protein [Pseudonocardia sp.]